MARRNLVLSSCLAVIASLLPFGARADVDAVDLATSAAAYAQGCDPIDPRLCLLPFPNDLFTTADATTDTGKRLNLLPTATPRNRAGKPIDPAEWNRNDGFSPGSLIETFIPRVDLDATGAPSIKNPGASLSPSSPVVVLNASTGRLHPIWVERDHESWSADDNQRSTLIRPAVNFAEGTRYVVALRDVKNLDGDVIPASRHFRCFRDNECSENPLVEARRPHMNSLFASLAAAGIARSNLYLAWDFTVASERNLSERILHMRDVAFASLGDTTMADGVIQGDAPVFAVTGTTNNPDANIARTVEGVFAVPNFLPTGVVPGTGFVYGPDGLPVRMPNDYVAQFTCHIPRSALSDGASTTATVNAARPSLYGHGLLGSRTEVGAGNVRAMANEHRFVFCATEWAGMSTTDIPNAVHTLLDVSNFSTMTDRMQQGFVNQMFLGRLMAHPQGLAADPAFEGPAGASVIDTSELFYDGNSQGGIMGGALMAVTPDVRRGVLGVPAMNYSTLLDRSVDWSPLYYTPMQAAYADRIDHQLIFSLLQILWDRGEANGYAHHMTSNPFTYRFGPKIGQQASPPHTVLMHVALGDHQVANVAAEVEARTIGAAIWRPAVAAGKIPAGMVDFWNLPQAADGSTGSVMVFWDSGNAWSPLGNIPSTDLSDPHGRPRSNANARIQKSRFLQTAGYFSNVCGATACLAP